ncbi:hypothetical protein T492DRAFT_867768 [Pavlovales sp. CCMP2436]|nr:hypothetical protein T492DRAFT_867768 [Pavlovales sp. CCMP2436]
MASGVGACVDVLHADTLLLVRGGGTTALTCFWNDGHTLMANLNTRTAFQPGMSVRMRDGVLAPHGHSCPGSDACATGLVRALSTTSPCGALACPVPTALLVGPTAISNCPNATIVLDSSASTPAGIVLPTYEWSVVAANTTNAAEIAAALAALPADKSVITLGASLLGRGSGGAERYVFALRMRSFLGKLSDVAQLKVVRSGRGPSPTVAIHGPCAPLPSLGAQTSARLTLPAGALYAGRSYSITVRVAMRAQPDAYAESTVTVTANAPLNLDASSSADPSALPSAEAMAFGFAWSVSWQRNSSEAAEAGGDEEFEAVALPAGQGSKAVLVLPAGWLAVGDYLASVAILSANGRGANASVSINAVSAPVPRVTLVPLPGKPSADDRLVLRALAVTIDDADAAAVALVAAGLATSAADALARNVQANELPWAYTWVGYSDSANRAQLDLNDPAAYENCSGMSCSSSSVHSAALTATAVTAATPDEGAYQHEVGAANASSESASVLLDTNLLEAQVGAQPSPYSVRLWAESVAALHGAAYVHRLASSSELVGIDTCASFHLARSFTTVLAGNGVSIGDESRAKRDGLVSRAARFLALGLLKETVVGEASLVASSATVSVFALRAASSDPEVESLRMSDSSAGSVQLGSAAAAADGEGGLDVHIPSLNSSVASAIISVEGTHLPRPAVGGTGRTTCIRQPPSLHAAQISSRVELHTHQASAASRASPRIERLAECVERVADGVEARLDQLDAAARDACIAAAMTMQRYTRGRLQRQISSRVRAMREADATAAVAAKTASTSSRAGSGSSAWR